MKEELTRKATIEGVRLLWPVAPAADNSAEGDGGGLRPNWYPVGRHGVEFRDDPTGGDGSPSRIVGLTSIIATEGKGVMPSSLSLAVVYDSLRSSYYNMYYSVKIRGQTQLK